MKEAFDDLHGSLAVNVQLYEIFTPLFTCYRAQWLTKIGPHNYSVYGKSTYCNNVTERYHRTLKDKTTTRPEILKFFGEFNNQHWTKRFFIDIYFSFLYLLILLKYRVHKKYPRRISRGHFAAGPPPQTMPTGTSNIKKRRKWTNKMRMKWGWGWGCSTGHDPKLTSRWILSILWKNDGEHCYCQSWCFAVIECYILVEIISIFCYNTN